MSRLAVPITALAASAAVALLAGCAGPGGPGGDTDATQAPAGYAGSLRFQPDPAELPETALGCVRSLVLELRNESPDLGMTIERAELSDPALDLVAPLPLTLAPGGAEFADLHFRPRAAGTLTAAVSFWTDDGAGQAAELAVAALAVEPPPPPADPGPLDLVLVVDVSTTMDGLTRLRAALPAWLESADAAGVDLRVGLVTFVNDIAVHGDGAFLPRASLLGELGSQLDPETGGPNLALPRHQMNFDFPENSLGALSRAARAFAFRPEARRALLLVTDAGFLEPPAVYSDGTPATVSYAALRRTLDERGLALHALLDGRAGRGFSAHYDGTPPLVRHTSGHWLELREAARDESALPSFLTHLALGRSCN